MAMNGPVEGHPDDLTLIGGIGPKIQILLNELGVWHYDQIAEWTPENVAWVDEHLNFNGRIIREGWVEQRTPDTFRPGSAGTGESCLNEGSHDCNLQACG